MRVKAKVRMTGDGWRVRLNRAGWVAMMEHQHHRLLRVLVDRSYATRWQAEDARTVIMRRLGDVEVEVRR